MKEKKEFCFTSLNNLFVVLYQTHSKTSDSYNGSKSRIIIEAASPQRAEEIIKKYFERQNLRVTIEIISPVRVLRPLKGKN